MFASSMRTTCACWRDSEVRVSHEWLGSMVDLEGVAAKEVERLLTVSGTEVERITEFAGGLESLIIGEVVEFHRLEGSDHLFLATVRGGGPEPSQVVCGAPNLFVGALIPWARPGTRLPSGIEIGRRRIRGTQSEGMLCALDELGLGSDHEGVLTLYPGEAEPGQPLAELFPQDTIYELEILSNRADCLSHLGVATELAAMLGRPVNPGDTTPVPPEGESLEGRVEVTISAPELCSLYTACSFTAIPQRPAPLFIRRRLLAVGQRSLGAVVDLANYVMLDVGQPLHTFDLDRIQGDDGRVAIEVRRARSKETMLGLDQQERHLDERELVIAANGEPAAIAGLMGSSHSAVTPATTNLLLESASFQWTSVRAASRRLGLRTEASSRFERFLSPNLVPTGARRFARLLNDHLGAAPRPGSVMAGALPQPPEPIRISAERISRLLGMEVTAAESGSALERLGFAVEMEAQDLLATPPSRRTDVTRPVDLVEEVGRILGYDRLPSTLPPLRQPPADQQGTAPGRLVGEILMGAGYTECITLSLSDPGRPTPVSGMGEGQRMQRIGNPLSGALEGLRVSLLPGLLASCQLNQARGAEQARLFEQGRAFWSAGTDGRPQEPELVAVVDHDVAAEASDSAATLRHLIRVCQALGDRLSIEDTTFRAVARPGLHPVRCAEVRSGGEVRGVVGELDPRSCSALELRGRVVVAELRVDGWLIPGGRPGRARDLAATPPLIVDLAVTVPEAAQLGEALRAVGATGPGDLEEIRVWDEYRGSQLGPGLKGWTFRLVFRDSAKTLTGRQGAELRDRVMTILQEVSGARAR